MGDGARNNQGAVLRIKRSIAKGSWQLYRYYRYIA
jgi:hypothetical protein